VGGYNSGMGQTSIPRQLTYSGMNPRVRFYGIIAIVAVVGYLFFSSGVKDKKTDKNAFKTTSTSLTELVEAEKRTKELLTVKKEKLDTIQYRRAQENFVKGFRDFNQGQYARARDSFQVVLNLDPENELARRYFHLSTVKFEEFIKFNMIQGNRYREKRNWRMCQSNFSNVMTMLQYLKNDPTYKEAKQYYDECTLNLEGRY
jgi:tetratricopeptide (TPR) repeat protein